LCDIKVYNHASKARTPKVNPYPLCSRSAHTTYLDVPLSKTWSHVKLPVLNRHRFFTTHATHQKRIKNGHRVFKNINLCVTLYHFYLTPYFIFTSKTLLERLATPPMFTFSRSVCITVHSRTSSLNDYGTNCNSTQLNEHLWTQVLKHLSVHIYLVTSVLQSTWFAYWSVADSG